MGAYLNLVALKSRREAYIDEAKLTSSIVNIATTLGYNVNRATSASYSINVYCSNPIFQKKQTPIGTYNSFPVSLMSDTKFSVGDNNVTVLLGTWKTYASTGATSAAYSRIFIQDNVDNNLYTLYINDKQVEVVKFAELLNSNNVLIRSYFSGLYLIFGDGILGRLLNVDDQIRFDYFVPSPVNTDSAFDSNKISCNVGNVGSGNVITYGSNADSNAKLAVVAPGYYTAKRRLVTYSDYKNVALSYNGVISCGVQKHPGICCTVDLSIIGDGGRLFTDSENASFLSYMDTHQVIGTNIILVQAEPVNVSVKLTIVADSLANQTYITSIIENYLQSMTLKLSQFFSISGILNLNLPNVIGVYPQYPITDKQAAYNQYFSLKALSIEFTTSFGAINSFGTNINLGYT